MTSRMKAKGGRMKDEDGRGKEGKKLTKNLKARTKDFALRVIRLYSSLSKATEAQVLGKQLLKSGTSVGAHYWEAQRAKSDADFISKTEGALQELEETGYWLELLRDSGLVAEEKVNLLMREVDELAAIFVSIVKNVKSKQRYRKN
jgi:four helix bundle protein